jgi:hypothetical protein
VEKERRVIGVLMDRNCYEPNETDGYMGPGRAPSMTAKGILACYAPAQYEVLR